MEYYAQYNPENTLVAIGTGKRLGGIEITEAEYNALRTEIRTKVSLVNKLYNGDITIADVPAEWQEEIQRRVDERIAVEGEADEQEINSEEFMSMMEEVL